ncbi:unnamed protein product [Prunus armeniaca]|uniref:Uncharacterized protein n=1 Tax=Prunus armeniaca TaxID=36596 RepID=A0A6J5XAZ5_PRUAR|nr:unnamed protein product [Prunus armeniaca]
MVLESNALDFTTRIKFVGASNLSFVVGLRHLDSAPQNGFRMTESATTMQLQVYTATRGPFNGRVTAV